MKYVNLGRSGLKVSRLCLGCMSYGEPERLPQPWSLDEKASRPLIRQALEAGINFFDTANIYSGGSSEESALYRRIFYGSLALCKNAAYR